MKKTVDNKEGPLKSGKPRRGQGQYFNGSFFPHHTVPVTNTQDNVVHSQGRSLTWVNAFWEFPQGHTQSHLAGHSRFFCTDKGHSQRN